MSRSSSLVPAVFALVGTLIGYGIASTSQTADAPSSGAPALSPGDAHADPNLAALLDEVRALGDRIAALAGERVSLADRRTPIAEGAAPDSDRVVELLERCTALIERLERSASGAATAPLAPPPPSASREGMRSIDPGGFEQEKQLTRAHLLWSYQQVLDEYGHPDEIRSSSGTVYWMYEIDRGADELTLFTFTFTDGMASGVGVR